MLKSTENHKEAVVVKVTIITPVFNGEAYIDRYMSVLDAQTNKDFEVIIVDDCSTDKTWEILQRHTACHQFSVSVFRQPENKGPGVARNVALEYAGGEYVTFIDVDDRVQDDYVDNLLKEIEKTDSDLVIFDFIREGQSFVRRERVVLSSQGNEYISKEDAFRFSHISCAKIFKTSVIKDNALRFPALYRGEDGVFARIFVKYAEKIYYSNYVGYFYLYNPKSIMHGKVKRIAVERIEQNYIQLAKSSYAKEFMEEFKDYPQIIFELWIEDLLYGIGRFYSVQAPNRWFARYIREKTKEQPDWYRKINKKECSIYRRCIYFAIKIKSVILLKIFIGIKKHLV